MSISGELVTAVNVDEAVKRIGASWHRATQSIIETAELILDYTQSAEWSEIRERLIGQKIMSKTVISMLTSIAENPILTAPENIPLLPASYNTLYQLHKLERNLPKVFEAGLVTPDLTFEDIRDIRTRIQGDGEVSGRSLKEPKDKMVTFVKVKIPEYAFEENSDGLARIFDEIAVRFPFIELEYSKR